MILNNLVAIFSKVGGLAESQTGHNILNSNLDKIKFTPPTHFLGSVEHRQGIFCNTCTDPCVAKDPSQVLESI